jgi:caffeoyl-CoA O-methyltransferase
MLTVQENLDISYLNRLHKPPTPLLLELEQRGQYDEIPIVSRETGRLLSTLVHAMQASRILEIGTAYGYSTLWMALALPLGGRIWTIDPDRARTEIARDFITRAGKENEVEFVNQPALELLRAFSQRNVDIIFIDAIKEEYKDYLDLCIPLLKLSGLVIVDNLLWHGRAAQKPSSKDLSTTKAIREFNKYFLNHPQLDATIIPLGDGTGIGARIE